MPPDQIGAWFGPTIMFGGCLGVSFGGWLSDRLGARDPSWYMRMPAISCVAMVPFALGFLLLDESVPALLFFVPAYAVANMYVGPLWSTAQNLARPGMRATASAVLLLVLNIVGLGAGPLLVGVLNDALEPSYGQLSIRYSLLLVTLVGGLAGVFFWIGSRSFREDMATRDA
jgi:MFS family permease